MGLFWIWDCLIRKSIAHLGNVADLGTWTRLIMHYKVEAIFAHEVKDDIHAKPTVVHHISNATIYEESINVVSINGSQLAKMKMSTPDMSLPWNL